VLSYGYSTAGSASASVTATRLGHHPRQHVPIRRQASELAEASRARQSRWQDRLRQKHASRQQRCYPVLTYLQEAHLVRIAPALPAAHGLTLLSKWSLSRVAIYGISRLISAEACYSFWYNWNREMYWYGCRVGGSPPWLGLGR